MKETEVKGTEEKRTRNGGDDSTRINVGGLQRQE